MWFLSNGFFFYVQLSELSFCNLCYGSFEQWPWLSPNTASYKHSNSWVSYVNIWISQWCRGNRIYINKIIWLMYVLSFKHDITHKPTIRSINWAEVFFINCDKNNSFKFAVCQYFANWTDKILGGGCIKIKSLSISIFK